MSQPDKPDISRLLDTSDLVQTSTPPPAQEKPPQKNPAQASFLITQVQKERLRELGYGEDVIRTMPPEVAHKLLLKLGPENPKPK